MSLEFVLGSATESSDTVILERVDQWLREDPNHEVIYLVPNHLKFETEVHVLQSLRERDNAKHISTMKLQIFSFSRLAWYYLQNTPFYSSESLTETGSGMLVRKILIEKEEELQLFRGEIRKPGFIQQLVYLIQEMIKGDVVIEDIAEVLTQLNENNTKSDLNLKLKDFMLVYDEYLKQLADKEIDSLHLLKNLSNFLKSKDLSSVLFVLDGYASFSGEELKVIETFMTQGSSILCHLILNRPAVNQVPPLHELFYETGTLYFEIYQLARRLRVPIRHDHYSKKCERTSEDLALLDQFWEESHQIGPLSPLRETKEIESIKVWEAENTYTEMQHVAKEIRRLVASGKYRYQDIRLITREMPIYAPVISPIFHMHDIPIYIDEEIEMKHHPLVEFLQALFAIKQKYYRYSDIMRLLRTELFIPNQTKAKELEQWEIQQKAYREKIDVTENVILMYGYEGYAWIKKEDWTYIAYDFEKNETDEDRNYQIQEISNEIRRAIRDTLPKFFDSLEKADTGLEGATLFYQFLDKIGIENQLRFWRDQEIVRGNLSEARIHEQTWQALVKLLDEYVLLLREEPFSLPDFIEIFSAGLENLSYSKVPTTIDQVMLTSYDRTKQVKNKVVMIIGATDQAIPAKIENQTLLSDEERDEMGELLQTGKHINEATYQRLAKEPFLAYLNFLSASELLYLTYPAVRDDQKDIKISPYIERIVRYFNIGIAKKAELPIANKSEENLSFIGTYRTLISDMIRLKRYTLDQKIMLSPFWRAMEIELDHQSLGNLSLKEKIFKSLTRKNIPHPLRQEIIDQLYGKQLYSSVSRIETFYQCEYKYLMQYGLGLKEREVFGLSSAATGEFYHEALDQLFKVVITQNLSLANLSEEGIQQVTKEILTNVLGQTKFSILKASNRMLYIQHQLSKTIERVSWALRLQSQRTGMTVKQTEVVFGHLAQQQGLDSLNVPLENDGILSIRGKIDRVDWIEIEGKPYLEVVDYKSSSHSFDFREAYFGLALQMVTYLDVALTNAVKLVGKPAEAAGAFYLHVQNPLLKGQTDHEKQERDLLEQFKYNGILLQNYSLLKRLDHTVAPKEKSLLYPFNETAKEEFKSSQFVKDTEMEGLIQHNRRKLQEAGNQILKGSVQLNPAYRDKQRIACGHCSFRSICQFDVLLDENRYNRIDRLKKDEVLKRMREEGEENA